MILIKKILVAIVGGVLLVAGLAMLVLPGPAVVVIPAALAILALQFVWARRCLAWLRERFKAFSSHNSPGITLNGRRDCGAPPNPNPNKP